MNIIFAHDLSGGIGYKGELPWRITEDLQFFSKTVANHKLVVGITTFKTLPKKYHEQCVLASRLCEFDRSEPFFVIGGAKIYEAALKQIQPGDCIWETKIYGNFNADTYFKIPDEIKKGTIKKTIFDGICEEKKNGGRFRVKIRLIKLC